MSELTSSAPASAVVVTETPVPTTPATTVVTGTPETVVTPATAAAAVAVVDEAAVRQARAARHDLGWAAFILRLWLATFCITAGITKFQTANPAGGNDIFDPNAWSGGIVAAKSADGTEVTKNAVWSGAPAEGEVIAKGWRIADGMHKNGGPILNNPAWTSPDGKGFDLVNLYAKTLPWMFLIFGFMVLLGVTKRLAPALAAMVCLSLAFGLWSMFAGAESAVTVLPLWPGFLSAIGCVALARFQPLCLLPKF